MGHYQAFEGVKAKAGSFESISAQSQIISLFTHATTGGESQRPRVEFIDTSLYLSDLYMMHIPTEIVVLGACETGIGKVADGEGVMSLARGFAHAGSASMVASLWNVNDLYTAKLLDDFYHYLGQSKSKSEALHQAKLDFLNQEQEIVLPAQWAAFVLIGDAEKLSKPANNAVLYCFLGGLLVLGLVVLSRGRAA